MAGTGMPSTADKWLGCMLVINRPAPAFVWHPVIVETNTFIILRDQNAAGRLNNLQYCAPVAKAAAADFRRPAVNSAVNNNISLARANILNSPIAYHGRLHRAPKANRRTWSINNVPVRA